MLPKIHKNEIIILKCNKNNVIYENEQGVPEEVHLIYQNSMKQ